MSESSPSNIEPAPAPALTPVQWLICFIACVGFLFDTYELLMLPLIIKPAITALHPAGAAPDSWLPTGENFSHWARLLFFVPAIAGGAFGLLGGYLTDLLGRRRVLTWSILLYALAACASAYSTTLPELLFCRCLVFIGVCVEFVAAVAWLAELFPQHKRREKILGYTQAFSSVGGVMLAVLGQGIAAWAHSLPAIRGGHDSWRYTLLSGVIPAIPLILIRPFLPESPIWAAKRAAGTLKRPSLLAVFAPGLRKTTILTTIGFASTFGLAYGAIQQHSQIVTGHVDVKNAVKQAAGDAAARYKYDHGPAATMPQSDLADARANTANGIVANVQTYQETGGLIGRVLMTLLIVWIASKRSVLRIFQIPALVVVPLLFWWMSKNLDTPGSLQTFKWGMFLAGLLVVGQMNFWGNYIPLVFPVHLRGTGETVAANIGGRVIGTAAAFLTITFSASRPANPAKMALAAAAVALAYALAGTLVTHWLPEPKESASPVLNDSDAGPPA